MENLSDKYGIQKQRGHVFRLYEVKSGMRQQTTNCKVRNIHAEDKPGTGQNRRSGLAA